MATRIFDQASDDEALQLLLWFLQIDNRHRRNLLVQLAENYVEQQTLKSKVQYYSLLQDNEPARRDES